MVSFKNRWILFEIVEDPVLEHGKVTFKHTSLEVSDSALYKALRDSVELNYGSFGRALLQNAGGKKTTEALQHAIITNTLSYSKVV
jgi:ribonuclease P/MRP protein subunit POP5